VCYPSTAAYMLLVLLFSYLTFQLETLFLFFCSTFSYLGFVCSLFLFVVFLSAFFYFYLNFSFSKYTSQH